MAGELRRKTPEEFLREVQAEEAASGHKGYLKIVLGYASGVGKSFRMLDEARRRRERGQDIVIGAVQPRLSPEVESLLQNLEVIPLTTAGGTEIDVEAIIRRRAHGLRHRWPCLQQPSRGAPSRPLAGCSGTPGCRHKSDRLDQRAVCR